MIGFSSSGMHTEAVTNLTNALRCCMSMAIISCLSQSMCALSCGHMGPGRTMRSSLLVSHCRSLQSFCCSSAGWNSDNIFHGNTKLTPSRIAATWSGISNLDMQLFTSAFVYWSRFSHVTCSPSSFHIMQTSRSMSSSCARLTSSLSATSASTSSFFWRQCTTLTTPPWSSSSRSLTSWKPSGCPRISLSSGFARHSPGICPCCSALPMNSPTNRSRPSTRVRASLSSGSPAGNNPALRASPASRHTAAPSSSSPSSSAATFSKNLRVGPDPCPASPFHVTSSTVSRAPCALSTLSAHCPRSILSSCPSRR
mmetsp:Transcript_16727/g.40373  ORF Transcript_16727/g.40373 Transcript_16727/m.40373 type:complete len:311 (+) Transcript_16727:291-1223(+)